VDEPELDVVAAMDAFRACFRFDLLDFALPCPFSCLSSLACMSEDFFLFFVGVWFGCALCVWLVTLGVFVLVLVLALAMVVDFFLRECEVDGDSASDSDAGDDARVPERDESDEDTPAEVVVDA